MGQVEMKISLLAHTHLSEKFKTRLLAYAQPFNYEYTNGQAIALTAIRACYSHKKPSDIVITEAEKYFGDKGKEGKRLFKQIVKSGHTSTLEHISFTFAVEGVSRALLAQLTRHRVGFSYSVQSQRYVPFGSESRSGGFDYVAPEKISAFEVSGNGNEALNALQYAMQGIQDWYDHLIGLGIPQEDARVVLPNAAATNLVLTVNLRAMLDFYRKRKTGKGAQHEITVLAEKLKDSVVQVEPWTAEFFEME